MCDPHKSVLDALNGKNQAITFKFQSKSSYNYWLFKQNFF